MQAPKDVNRVALENPSTEAEPNFNLSFSHDILLQGLHQTQPLPEHEALTLCKALSIIGGNTKFESLHVTDKNPRL